MKGLPERARSLGSKSRVLQVARELEHIQQYREGKSGEDHRHEREFLALYHAAYRRVPHTMDEKALAAFADTSALADETDWEALYGDIEENRYCASSRRALACEMDKLRQSAASPRGFALDVQTGCALNRSPTLDNVQLVARSGLVRRAGRVTATSMKATLAVRL